MAVIEEVAGKDAFTIVSYSFNSIDALIVIVAAIAVISLYSITFKSLVLAVIGSNAD